MELDAERLPDGTRLEADLCIVGAGPAGIALANEFIGLNLRVLVVESGGLGPDQGAQELNGGTMLGEPALNLRDSRHRGAGGAVHLWNTWVDRQVGAKYAPLDPGDFTPRPHVSLSGWPFQRSHLEPFYRRAQEFAGLGPFAYDGNDWVDARRPCLPLPDDGLTTAIYQFGRSSRILEQKLGALRTAGNISLCYHATVATLEASGSMSRMARARVRCRSGSHVDVQARIFVLAAGAIENARVLLASGEIAGVIPGNRYEWVGRCFMEHPRDHALTLVPRSPELFREAAFYDAHHAPDGTIIGGRLALRESVIQNARLPNASVTLLPQETTTAGGIPLLTRLLRRCPRLGALGWRGGYGWSRVADPARRFEAFRLIVNLEQHPNPDNRVVLGTGRDALGVPRTELHWRWRAEEQKDLERLRGVIVAALEGGRLGTVKVAAGLGPDPHAHHHAGTTRMHADPRQGVVDPDARVHGTDNLYITGASVFPTAGFANPTLTIVAMALRLADLLKNRL